MKKTNPNFALVKFLDSYCTSSIAPGYAVMLQGPWGSGKTWFIDNYRKELLSRMNKRTLYVSLFGVSKPADIVDQFFTQLHPKLASAPVQKGWSLAKSLVKGTIKLDLNDDGKDDVSLKIDLPELGKWASTDGVVLIFDDL